MENLGFKCLRCNGTNLSISSTQVLCNSCNETYPVLDGVFDFLYNPSADVVKELTGMALENGYKKDDFLEFRINKTNSSPTIAEKLDVTKNDYNQYYQQTLTNFTQAFRLIQKNYKFKGANVLEIGSCYDYYFLTPFKDLGSHCYAINLHFDITADANFRNFPVKILADMNKIPFQDSFFDIVVISATSHHSNTPEILLKEINRILKINGSCLMINDPISGSLKSLGSTLMHNRDSHINENEYTLSHYNKMFKENNFEIHHLFSEYHDQKLSNAVIHPQVRFSKIAEIVSYLWKFPIIQRFIRKYCLAFAQSVLGFPMNVVLIKK